MLKQSILSVTPVFAIATAIVLATPAAPAFAQVRPGNSRDTRTYQSRAYDYGYRDGLARGEQDGRSNRAYSLDQSREYQNGDRGYERSQGNLRTYQQTYRDAYATGYRDGYERNRGNTGYGGGPVYGGIGSGGYQAATASATPALHRTGVTIAPAMGTRRPGSTRAIPTGTRRAPRTARTAIGSIPCATAATSQPTVATTGVRIEGRLQEHLSRGIPVGLRPGIPRFAAVRLPRRQDYAAVAGLVAVLTRHPMKAAPQTVERRAYASV